MEEKKKKIYKSLFTNELWNLDTGDMPRWRKRIVRFMKLLRITVDTFFANKMGFQCVALSYFVALAVIPLVALIFVVTNGLGLGNYLQEVIATLSPQYPDIINFLSEKATNIIDSAKSGTVGLISALAFIWTILWLMFQVERVFNNVWGITKVPRKLYTRFSFYILVTLLLPFLVLIFGVGIAYMTNLTALIGLDLENVQQIWTVLGWVTFYAITVLTLSAMYKFIPAVKVKYIHALKSAAVCAVFFVGFQYLYLETQIFVSSVNGVYGAIAAIPLFLIWMNFSWQIIIYGAELCYGFHNIDTYKI